MERNSHPIKVAKVADEGFYANSHPYKVVIVGGGGSEGRVVDELPEIGEPGYIYLVLKEESSEGNIYDEYMWVLLQDGETYGWEHIGATNEVKIEIDDELSTTSENPVQNKVITNALENIKPTTATELVLNEDNTVAYQTNLRGFNKIGYLEPGVYTIKYDFATTPSKVFLGCEAFNHPEALYPSATLQVDDGVTFVISGQKLADTRQVLVLNRAANAYLKGFYGTFGSFYRPDGTQSQLGYYGNSSVQTGILTGSSIIDRLTGSTSGLTVLSARQGQVLAERIGNLSDLTTTDKTSTVAAINELAAKDSGIPQTATFWDQSYDATNNKVDGTITTTANNTAISQHSASKNFGFSLGVMEGNSTVSILPTRKVGSQWPNYGGSIAIFEDRISVNGGSTYIGINRRITNVADPTQAQDAATKNYTDNLVINYSAINGASAPTTATEGKYVGQLYYDTTNEQLYFLKEINDTVDPATYTWETLGGGNSGIPTDATFWGASYNSTSNSVSGAIALGGNDITGGTFRPFLNSASYMGFSGSNQPIFRGSNVALTGQAPSSSNEQTILSVQGTTVNQRIFFRGANNTQTLRLSGITDPTAAQDAATKNYVDNSITSAISGITGVQFEVVATLPAAGDAGTIYLVPNAGTTPNIYDEYIYVNNAFEKIGTTEIDLSNYVTDSELQTALLDKADVSDIPTKTSDLTNDGADGTSTYVEATDIADVVYKGTQISTTSPNIISTPMIQDGAVTAAKLGNDVNFLSLTMSTTDIGEGAPLAANTLYGVYE